MGNGANQTAVPLSNPRQVAMLLERASSRRAVAATLMNERSSRSHSVFSLKVRGVNPLTNEQCEGTLNLGMSIQRPPVEISHSKKKANREMVDNEDKQKLTFYQSTWQGLKDSLRPERILIKIE